MSTTIKLPTPLDMHDPDHELIALCQQAVAAFQEARTILEAGTELVGPDFNRNWARANVRAVLGRRLAKRIAKLPAYTLAGIRARASAVPAAMPIDYGIGDSIPIDWHHGMLDTLLRDLARGGVE